MPKRLTRAIKNDEQYQNAFLHYEILINTNGTPNEVEISRLEKLINDYELENNVTPASIKDSHLISYFLRRLNMTQLELAEKLDVSQPLINRILNDGIKISNKLAAKISEEFNLSPDIFLSRSTASLY